MNVFQEQSTLLYVLAAFGLVSNILLICILSWVKRIALQLGWVDPAPITADNELEDQSLRTTCAKCKENVILEEKEKLSGNFICPYCGQLNTICIREERKTVEETKKTWTCDECNLTNTPTEKLCYRCKAKKKD